VPQGQLKSIHHYQLPQGSNTPPITTISPPSLPIASRAVFIPVYLPLHFQISNASHQYQFNKSIIKPNHHSITHPISRKTEHALYIQHPKFTESTSQFREHIQHQLTKQKRSRDNPANRAAFNLHPNTKSTEINK